MRNLTYKKRVQRIRKKLKKNNESRFRLSVYRSNRNISAQIIDDKNNKTLVSVSSLGHKTTGKNKKSDLSNYIAELISKADLAISRCGSSTIGELEYFSVPFVSDDKRKKFLKDVRNTAVKL